MSEQGVDMPIYEAGITSTDSSGKIVDTTKQEQDYDILLHEAGITSTDSSGKTVDTTKQLLLWLYTTHSKRLTLKANIKGKNKLLWRHFQIACIDNVEQPYAMCQECLSFVKYSGRTGTGGLVRHYCFRKVFAALEPRQLLRNSLAVDLPKAASRSPGREEVEGLVHNNSPRIGFVPNYKGKSDVWNQFDIITLDNETVNFASCKLCRSIVTYVSRTGTGSMTRHKCINKPRSTSPTMPENLSTCVKQEPIDEEVESNQSEEASPPPPSRNGIAELQLKAFSDLLQANLQSFRTKMEPRSPMMVPQREPPEDLLRRQYLSFVRRSLNVFHALRNDAFFDMAQTLVNIGAEFGQIDVRQVLADAADLNTIFETDS